MVYILVPEELKVLLLRLYSTDGYSQHMNAYTVTPTTSYDVIRIHELALHDVFTVHTLSSLSYVVVRSCCHVEVAAS